MARRLLSLKGVNTKQMISAGISGALGTMLDVAVLVLLVEHGAAIAVSAFAGATAGGALNFVLNKYLAFKDPTPINSRQLARFALVATATALLMAGAMQVVAVWLGVPYLLAKFLCAITVFAVWTYPAQRKLVFRTVVPAM